MYQGIGKFQPCSIRTYREKLERKREEDRQMFNARRSCSATKFLKDQEDECLGTRLTTDKKSN